MSLSADIALAEKEFAAKNYRAAEQLFTQSIEASTDLNLDLFKRRSECYYELGQYQDSFDDAQLWVEHKPDVTQGFFLCGRALAKLEKFEEALSVYRQGLEINSKDPDLTEGLKTMQNDILQSYEKKSAEGSYNAVKMSSQDPYPGS